MDPTTLPLFDPAPIVSLGKITIPGRDSVGALIAYGAGASGFSEDGTRIYVACNSTPGNNNQTGRGYIWTGTIPAIGGTSQEIAPCTGLSFAELGNISGNPSSDSPLVGSVIDVAGKFILGGYITYDASGSEPRKTWWVGPSLSQLTGPVEGAVRNGLVKGGSSRIPPEWQSLLGGDVAVADQFSSIISRGSYGAAFTTFWAKDAGAAGFAMNLLMGCPSNDPASGAALPQCTSRYTEGKQSLMEYNGSEKIAAMFIVPGTRTLMVILREAYGPMCYGYATPDKSKHGQIHPGPEGVHWCYSLSGDPFQKGMHGYPYVHLALLYDLADLVAVKQGTKKPWDVAAYGYHIMPGSRDDFDVGYRGGGVFNPRTGQYYLLRELYPNGQGGADVEVYGGWPKAGDPPPPPPTDKDCVFTTTVTVGDWLPVACPAPPEKPEQWATETTTITVVSPPEGNGKACPSSSTRQISRACDPPPPPPPTLSITASGTTRTCTLTVTATGKPDGTGWGIRFGRRLDGDATWINHGDRDTTAPYEQSRVVALGKWETRAIWSKTGATDVPVPAFAVWSCQP